MTQDESNWKSLQDEVRSALSAGNKGYRSEGRTLLQLARLAAGSDSPVAQKADADLQDRLECLFETAPDEGVEHVLGAFDEQCVLGVDDATAEQLYGHVESLTELQFDEDGEYLSFGVSVLVAHRPARNQRWTSAGLCIDPEATAQALKDYRLVCDGSQVLLFPELLDANVAGSLTYVELMQASAMLRRGEIASLRKLFECKVKSLDLVIGPQLEGASQVLCLFGLVCGQGGNPFPLADAAYNWDASDADPDAEPVDKPAALAMLAARLLKFWPVAQVHLRDAPFGWWSDERSGSRFIRHLLAAQRLQALCIKHGLTEQDLMADDRLVAAQGAYPQVGIRLYRSVDSRPVGVLPFPVLVHESANDLQTCALELLVECGVRVVRGLADDGEEDPAPAASIFHPGPPSGSKLH